MNDRRGAMGRAAAGLVLGVLLATTAGYAYRKDAAQPKPLEAAPASSCCQASGEAEGQTKAEARATKEMTPSACPMMPADGPTMPAGCPVMSGQGSKAPESCPMENAHAKGHTKVKATAKAQPSNLAPAAKTSAPAAKVSAPAKASAAAKVSSAAAATDGGFQPSAYPNVNVRFRPGASGAPRTSAASIYVRPGTDRAQVQRSRPAMAADAAPRQARVMPDGSLRLDADSSTMSFVTASRQPSGRIAVGCEANDSPARIDAAKGEKR